MVVKFTEKGTEKTMENLLGNIYYGEIILPDEIYVAVGREMNLWWSTAAVYEEGDRSVYFEVKCDIGLTSQRGFILCPTDEMIGDHTLAIRSRELHTRRIISERTVTVKVVGVPASLENKNILMIGDSRTWHSANGIQGKSKSEQGNKTTTTELRDLLKIYCNADFHFIGTKVSDSDSKIKNLADNGWCYSTALDEIRSAGGIVSYIENSCGEKMGTKLDYASIMYGINDFADWHQNNLDQFDLSFKKNDSIIENAKMLIDSILEGYPECKISLVLESSTSGNQDGFGYWGASDNDCQVEWEFNVKSLRKRIIEEFDGGKYSKNVILSTAGLWCDRVYSYPYVICPASSRADTSSVMRLNNCAHPHDDGYKQIADGDFSTIMYFESK